MNTAALIAYVNAHASMIPSVLVGASLYYAVNTYVCAIFGGMSEQAAMLRMALSVVLALLAIAVAIIIR